MKNGLVVFCLLGIVATIVVSGCENEKPSYGIPKEDPPENHSDTTLSGDANNNDLSSIANVVDECPNGDECAEDAVCEKGENLQISGIKSFCTKQCLCGIYCEEAPEFKPGWDKIACDNLEIASCCGKVITTESDEVETWCLPPENCCNAGFSVECGEECCAEGFICHETKIICVTKPNCSPDETICKYTCCSEDYKCSEDEENCEPKCQPPAPLYCKDECCPNNHSCECIDNGGFCLPEGAEMCDCEDKSWCEPLQECIDDKVCYEELVSQNKLPCKPLGAEDCPEAEDCYCKPGYICTHDSPACCASDEPVACGDYCCPDKNECLTDIKDCLPPGWDYCEQWKTECGVEWDCMCGVGWDCKELEPGCKDDDAYECDYGGIICSATEICVGAGKGVNGCCPSNQEVPCDGYCCPKGTHCEAGCGGCVIDNYFCCPDGVTTCFDYGNGNKQFCYSGGGDCLASPEQDCLAKGFGNYHCNAEEVCSSGPQKCCNEITPQTCGGVCCKSYEPCYEAGNGGFCVDELNGEEYCGDFFKCSPNDKCVTGKKVCIPDNAEICSDATGVSNCYCDNMQCCKKFDGMVSYGNFKCISNGLDCSGSGYCPPGSENRISCSICKPPGYVCCLVGSLKTGYGCDYKYQVEPIPYENVPDAPCF